MGQFEKIVVLVALLLVTAILAVTLTTDEDTLPLSMTDVQNAQLDAQLDASEGGESSADLLARDRTGSDQNARTRRERPGQGTLAGPGTPVVPVEDAPLAMPGGEPRPADGPEAFDLQARSQKELERKRLEQQRLEQGRQERERATESDLLLDDSFDPSAVARGAGVPDGAALVTLTGLRDTWEADLKEYVWRPKDTWASVAERYYGDRRKVELLRQFNEGLTAPGEGDAILVPVFDGRERSTEDVTNVDELGAEFYLVVEGDSLWGISKKVYGKGHLWERVYEANRNLLKSPDDVRPGMELYIP